MTSEVAGSESDDGTSGVATGRTSRPVGAPGADRRLRLALGLTLVPLVLSAVHLSVRYGNAYKPGGDLALLELHTRDVGQRSVLLGPYARGGWYHPGPAEFYLIAPLYRLLGSTSTAMNVAALAINGVAVAGMALLARRRGGAPLMLITLLGCALLMRSFGPDELRLPWNPFVTVLPYGLLVFLTWSLMCRDRWALPAAVFVASFLAQTHVGYVPLALPLVALGTLWLFASTIGSTKDTGGSATRSTAPTMGSSSNGSGSGSGPGGRGDRRGRDVAGSAGQRPPARRGDGEGDDGGGGGDVDVDVSSRARQGLVAPLAAAVAVGVAMWVPPLIQQVRAEPGNLRLVFEWFRDGGTTGEPSRGLVAGWRIASAQYGLPPEWLIGSRGVEANGEPPYLDRPLVPILLVVVVAAVVVLRRSRLPGSGRLVVLWLCASVAGIVATARTVGPVYTYRDGWASVLAMVAGVLVVWTAWSALAARRPELERRVLVPGAVAVLGILAVVSSVAHVRAGVPQREMSERLRDVMPTTVEALPAGDDPVLVDGTTSFLGAILAPGVLVQLERHGVEAVLPADYPAVEEHRRYDGRYRARLVIAPAHTIATYDRNDRLALVGYSGDVPLDDLRAQLADGQQPPPEAALAIYLRIPDR